MGKALKRTIRSSLTSSKEGDGTHGGPAGRPGSSTVTYSICTHIAAATSSQPARAIIERKRSSPPFWTTLITDKPGPGPAGGLLLVPYKPFLFHFLLLLLLLVSQFCFLSNIPETKQKDKTKKRNDKVEQPPTTTTEDCWAI